MKEQRIEGARLLGPRELVFELAGEFCIETTGRRVHRRLVDGLLSGELAGPAAEGAVELLARFLAEQDFPAIRAADEQLAGAQRAEVRVFRAPGGQVRWEKMEPGPREGPGGR